MAALALPVTIETVPTVRAADGLALSSRNACLDGTARAVALHGARAFAAADAQLLEAGFDRVDYVAVRQEANFAGVERLDGLGRVLGAAWLGSVRLIDNLRCGGISAA